MTYPVLALMSIAVAGAVAAVAYRVAAHYRAIPRRFWWAVAGSIVVLCVLTVVFDSVMIAADLFRYDESKLSGVRLWLAPIEDLGWPVAAGLAGPCVFLAVDAVARHRASRAVPPSYEGPK